MDIQRIASLKLSPSPEQAKSLRRTLEQYCSALNYISDIAHKMGNCSNYVQLHKAAYKRARQHFDLKSQLVISAQRQVASAYTSMRSNGNRKGKAVFRARGVMLQGGPRGRDFRLNPWHMVDVVSISTVDGRLKVPFTYGKQQSQYFDWPPGSAMLLERRKVFYLNVCFKTGVEVMSVEKATSVIGVDFGMNYLAVAAGPDSQTLFVGGGRIKDKKHHYGRVRRDLQAKGTKGAKRILKLLSGKEARSQKDVNHITSKRIVEFAAQYENPVIVLEDLTGIRKTAKRRKRQRGDFHSWAFYQLRQFIEYKAAALGIPVVTVDPRNTSKTCSKCGTVGRRNRHSFTCPCGCNLHSDLNAARNIALRFVVQRQLDVDTGEAQSIASEVPTLAS